MRILHDNSCLHEPVATRADVAVPSLQAPLISMPLLKPAKKPPQYASPQPVVSFTGTLNAGIENSSPLEVLIYDPISPHLKIHVPAPRSIKNFAASSLEESLEINNASCIDGMKKSEKRTCIERPTEGGASIG